MNTKAVEEKVFVEAIVGDSVSTASPWIGIFESDFLLRSYIYDYLMYPNQDGNTTPNLAESWWYMNGSIALATGESTSADLLSRNADEWPMGSIWEYNLTAGVTWSDGAPFNADDVKYTIDLQTGTNYSIFWAYQPYTKWIDHCQKVDSYKVRFFFTNRSDASKPAIPIAWGNCLSLPMMPKHLLDGMSPTSIAQDWNGIPAIGTGPFIGTVDLQSEIIAGEKITLLKNTEWETGLGSTYGRTCEIDKLIMKFYSDEQVMILDLKMNKIDAAEISPVNYLSLKTATDKPPGLKLVDTFSATVYSKSSHFNFDRTVSYSGLNPARLDPAIHRACAVATDRGAIASTIFNGLAVPGVGLISPVYTKWYYDAWNDIKNVSWFNVTSDTGTVLYSYNDTIADVMNFNITRANEILNASGYDWLTYPNGYRVVGDIAASRLVAMGAAADITSAKIDPGTGNPRILEFDDFLQADIIEDLAISNYLKSAWEEVGINLIPTAVSTATWYNVVYNIKADDLAETSWSGDPDPNYLLYVSTSYAMDGWNEWGKPNQSYDHCYNMQAHSLNESERIGWVQECEKYLFLSGAASMTTVYPKSCFAYLDWRWTGWGNWSQHPGLAIDHYWGETPLFMKIKWAGLSTTPTCTINSPTSGSNYWTGSSNINLGGNASDDVAVTSVTWSNAATGGAGTASGTTIWSIIGVPLNAGSNVITVIAHDGGGLTGSDTITVTYTPLSVTGTVNATSGTAPLPVSFTSTPTGGTAPYTYSWIFGDGGTSTQQNPSYMFSVGGTFTATVTITDSATHTAQWSSAVITVTGVVSVTGTASPTSGNASLQVSFTCTPTGGTTPYTYAWTFGDGETSTSQSPSHTYAAAGTYIAKVNVTDSASHSTMWASSAIIVTATAPSITITVSGTATPTSGTSPLNVSFTCSTSGGTEPYTYLWNFGDGTTSISQNATHSYSTAGNYTIKLTVTDSASHTGNWTTVITVTAPSMPAPPAGAGALDMLTIGLLAAIVIAAAGIGAFFMLKKRKKSRQQSSLKGKPADSSKNDVSKWYEGGKKKKVEPSPPKPADNTKINVSESDNGKPKKPEPPQQKPADNSKFGVSGSDNGKPKKPEK